MPARRPWKQTIVAAALLFLLWPRVGFAFDIPAPNPVIKIPGVSDFTVPQPTPDNCPEVQTIGASGCLFIPWIGQYIAGLYRFALFAATIAAVVVMMVAGYLWITAGGNVERVSSARGYIGGALTGLVLALGSYTILNLLNPKLVQFEALRIPVIEKIPLQVQILNTAKYCKWGQPVIDPLNQVTRCDWGGISKGVETCPGEKTSEGQICCCQPVDYQTGIEAQKPDAKPALASLIECIAKYDEITIASISDSNIASGICKPWRSDEQFGTKTACQHSRGSAHYGGPNGILTSDARGFSCAVDMKPKDGNYEKLYDIALRSQYCGASFAQCEKNGNMVACTGGSPDHVHASIDGCGAQ